MHEYNLIAVWMVRLWVSQPGEPACQNQLVQNLSPQQRVTFTAGMHACETALYVRPITAVDKWGCFNIIHGRKKSTLEKQRPDRTFHNFRGSKSIDWWFLTTENEWNDRSGIRSDSEKTSARKSIGRDSFCFMYVRMATDSLICDQLERRFGCLYLARAAHKLACLATFKWVVWRWTGVEKRIWNNKG